MSVFFPTVAPNEKDLRKIVTVVRNALDGKTNNTGSVTLSASVATTVKIDARVGAQSVLSFMATTANAATELAAGTMWVSSRGKQTFTITHANNAQTDRDFEYTVTG